MVTEIIFSQKNKNAALEISAVSLRGQVLSSKQFADTQIHDRSRSRKVGAHNP